MTSPTHIGVKLLLGLVALATLQQTSAAQVLDAAYTGQRTPRTEYSGTKKAKAWQAPMLIEPDISFQALSRRSLQETDPTVALALKSREIALQPGYDGVLSDQQLTSLYQQYLDLFNQTGLMSEWDCLSQQDVANDIVYFPNTTDGHFVIKGCSGTNLEIQNATTLRNVIFFNNTGIGMIDVLSGTSLDLINVVFLGNSGKTVSGIYVEQGSQLSATGLVMHGNAQRLSGTDLPDSAIWVDSACLTNLNYSTFVGNGWPAGGRELALDQGAVIYLTGAIGDDHELNLINSPICNMFTTQNVFFNNIANQDGGAMWLDSLKSIQVVYSDFVDNKAVNGFGGAIHVGETFYTSISFNKLISNHARQGGAVNVQSSKTIMTGNIITNNTADIGGAVQIFGNEASLTTNTYIGNNATYLGGALNAAKLSLVNIQDSQFKNNSAGTGGAAAIDAYNHVWVTNTSFTSNHVELNSPDATQCSADYLGGGGALCINTIPAGYSAFYGVSLTNCTFQDNSATNGGAMLFPALCGSGDTATEPCAEMALAGDDTLFTNNMAVGGTGDLIWMADSNNSMSSDCDGSGNYSTIGRLCPAWVSPSTAPSLVMHQPLASSAGELVIGTGNSSYFTQQYSLPTSLVSSAVTPMVLNVSVLLRDDYGKPIVTGSGDADATITANISDSRVQFIGSPIVAASNGIAQYNNLAIKAPAGNYTLTFTTESAAGRLLSSDITINVRGCRVGEVQASNNETLNNECTVCRDANQYSFNPHNISCDTCPSDAYCGYDGKNTELPPDGPIGAVLVPLSGYWHSSPRSSQVHLCPFPSACTGNVNASETQRKALVDYQKQLVLNETALQEIDVMEYNSLQCREGQYGNVCAGCLPGFGRRTEGECVKCPTRSLNSFILFLAVLIRIFMVGLTISSQLQAFKDEYNDPEPTEQPNPPTSPPGQPDSAMNSRQFVAAGALSNKSRLGTARSGSLKTLTVEQRVERCFGSDTTAFKVLINYLQITAILKGVTLELPAPVLRLLSAAGVVSNGVQSWISIDCSMFYTSTPKAIQATVVSVVIPFCILLFTLPFWVLWWQTIIRRKTNAVDLGSYLGSRLRITAIALAFYFYPQLVNSILSIFSCKQLDVQPSGGNTELLTAVGKWWTSDYNLQCYKGQHLVLMLALGIPGILIICVGIPVWSALLLRANKKYHKEMHFAATYALMYADYRDRYYYWESLVMLRKFVLVLLAVSIDASNPVLKLLACLAWIEASTIVVVAAKPFRLTRMDRLERVSNWGNAFTVILLALFFIDPSNEGLKVFCILCLILGNAAVIVYMVIQIFKEALYSLMNDLDAEARGMLLVSDLMSTPATDTMTKLKMTAVSTVLGIISSLPTKLSQWLVIYPCEQLKVNPSQGQKMSIIKQTNDGTSRPATADVVADDMPVARVHVPNIQLPTSESASPRPWSPAAPTGRVSSNAIAPSNVPAQWQRSPYL